MIRGWHPAYSLKRETFWHCAGIGKREFLTKFGREAFNDLPRWAIRRKHGRHVIVSMEDVQDQIWTIPANHACRDPHYRINA